MEKRHGKRERVFFAFFKVGCFFAHHCLSFSLTAAYRRFGAFKLTRIHQRRGEVFFFFADRELFVVADERTAEIESEVDEGRKIRDLRHWKILKNWRKEVDEAPNAVT